MKVFKIKFESPHQRYTQPKKGIAIILATEEVDARCQLRYHLANNRPVLNRNQSLLSRIVREANVTVTDSDPKESSWTQSINLDIKRPQLIHVST